MAAVTPTLQNRIQSLDVMRGFAILMILLANIWAFSRPEIGYAFFGYPELPSGELLAEAIREAFVSGKFRGMLAFLFGVGMMLQFNKRTHAAGQKWPGSYLKRTFLLILLGFIHGLFVWYGDILLLYGVTALVAMWLVKFNNKVLFWIAMGLMFVALIVGLGQMAGAGTDRTGGLDLFDYFLPANETRIFATGSYLEQLQYRGWFTILMLFQLPFMLPHIGSMFLFGMIVGRTGVLAAPSKNPDLTRTLSLIGIGGLVINLLNIPIALNTDLAYSDLIENGLNVPLAIGYVIWIAIIVEKGWLRPVTSMFAMVGKVALTVYLSTSLLCCAIFYSWGGGLFGKLTYAQHYGVVFGVWVLLILLAALWTKKFAMGPIEWLWRSASSGSKAPLTKAGALDAIAGIAPPPIAPPPAAPTYDPNRSSWPQ
ncbi:MAG: DUF418 domain-containing protein [Armatimonadetes bacterium]|nr:DUF418 domain-containing protein [Armatimonadota bacterium]